MLVLAIYSGHIGDLVMAGFRCFLAEARGWPAGGDQGQGGIEVDDFEHQAIFPAAELFLIRNFMKRRGIGSHQWLLGTGLNDQDLKHSEVRVSLRQFDMVYRNIYRLLPSPDTGLQLGLALNISRWGMLALAMISSRSLGAALASANRHRALVRSRFDLQPIESGDDVAIQIQPRGDQPFPVNREFGHEILIGTLQSQISDLLARPFHFSRITLAYPEPGQGDHYRQLCQCPVEFGSRTSALWLPGALLTERLPLANPVNEQLALQLSEQALAQVQQWQQADIKVRVQAALQASAGQLPSAREMAASLNLSERSLRRQLQQQGSSFRELIQQHQLRLALAELETPGSDIPRVAERCGFRDANGFREAFKRWTGMTPGRYRASFRPPGPTQP